MVSPSKKKKDSIAEDKDKKDGKSEDKKKEKDKSPFHKKSKSVVYPKIMKNTFPEQLKTLNP